MSNQSTKTVYLLDCEDVHIPTDPEGFLQCWAELVARVPEGAQAPRIWLDEELDVSITYEREETASECADRLMAEEHRSQSIRKSELALLARLKARYET